MAKPSMETSGLDRILTLEIARVTERAAVAAARLRGRGDEMAADQVAVDAMRQELNRLPIDGTVVIGEGERDEAPMLYIGEEVGTREGAKVDIALDPLEGTTICAKNLPNSLAVIAIAEKGSLLYAPDVYMEKIAIGPGYPANTVALEASADREHQCGRTRQGCFRRPGDGLYPGSAAPCTDDRGSPCHRCGNPADRRRRRGRGDSHD
jgi:fructose-1,6-bisphosphatase II / sedoheptulose-1,7-bisphosphatase